MPRIRTQRPRVQGCRGLHLSRVQRSSGTVRAFALSFCSACARARGSVAPAEGNCSRSLVLDCREFSKTPSLLSDTFLNQRPLEFHHGADDLEHEPSRWCAEVQVVAEGNERDAQGSRQKGSMRIRLWAGKSSANQKDLAGLQEQRLGYSGQPLRRA